MKKYKVRAEETIYAIYEIEIKAKNEEQAREIALDTSASDYKSSDLLMGISKQTYGINKRLLSDYEDWQITYVPHGISHRRFRKIEADDIKLMDFDEQFGLSDKKYKILYSNRNIRRKMPGDVVLAYKYFMDELTQEQRDAQDAKYIAANTKDYFTFLKKQNTTSTPPSTKKTTTTRYSPI